MRFAHLHCHSYFSMLRGTNSPQELCERALEFGMEALALTEVNGLYGWVEFVQICRHYGLRPLCGTDLWADDGRAVLLARDFKGYEQICQILSARHLDKGFSLVNALLQARTHLAILSRDIALLNRLARETGTDNLYVEIVLGEENASRLLFARAHRIKALATNDVFFKDPADHAMHRLLRAIDGNTKLSRLHASECAVVQRFFCNEDELRARLSFAPEAIDNAVALAQELEDRWTLGSLVFPPFDECSNAEAFFTLRWKCYKGARRRYGKITKAVCDRLEYELAIIRQKGFTHYFLVVDDIVQQAPRTCGRGSVAASIVSYSLGITHVDPLRHNLFFERFLNPERQDPPDADIDFPWDERDDILSYIFKKYGPTRAAMVCNHVRFQPKAALREVARVAGFSDPHITRVTEKWPRFAPERLPKPWDRLVAWARRLSDCPRHLSVHVGGVVIVPDDLRRYVPLERAPKGVNIIQWDKDQAEDFGLVKIDILGNRSLAVVRDALAAIASHTGHKIAYHDLDPTQDANTQEMLAKGQTMGVFYIESPAMRLLQQKAGVGDYEHLVIHSSIIRPASHRTINEYVERLHGKPWVPLHPALEEILRDSYGLMIYQEDVTKTAMALAGFTSAEGDGLRKALSKKRPKKGLLQYRQQFIAGARTRGVTLAASEEIWQMIEGFAGYSFCKPHSASYALVSFQSAYLRAHYPAEFTAAVISNQGGFYSTYAYLSEARRLGLTILPPDINLSDLPYRGAGHELRVGLMQLKGVREAWLQDVVRERERRGPFNSLYDFLARAPEGSSAEMRVLIRAGCFDNIAADRNRPQLLWEFFQVRLHGERERLALRAPEPWIPTVRDYTPDQKLHDEIDTLGLMVSRHPLTLYTQTLAATPHLPAKHMREALGQRVRMAGWLITGKVIATKTHEAMEFMTFEDLTGIYETVFFPQSYRQNGLLLNVHEPFWLWGKIADDHGAVTLHVERVERFGAVAHRKDGESRAEIRASA